MKLKVSLVTLLFFLTMAQAETPNQMSGAWRVEGYRHKLTDDKMDPEQGDWVFRNDSELEITTYSFGKMTQTVKYEIKDGKLVLDNGYKYEFVKRHADRMILKGPHGYQYFRKK